MKDMDSLWMLKAMFGGTAIAMLIAAFLYLFVLHH